VANHKLQLPLTCVSIKQVEVNAVLF